MVIFSRANTYNGETNIRGGNLSVEANGALGVGGAAGPITKVFDGATLSLRAVDYTTVQRLHIQGDGPTVDVGGVLQPFGAIHIPIANSTWSGPISLLGHSTIHIRPSSSLRVNGAIGDGPGAVTPDLRLRGGGTLELAKANNWSGRTIIADGTVTAQVDNALGKGKVVIFKGGTLRFENVNYTRLHQVDILPVQAPQTPPDLMSNAIEGSGISVFRGPISIFGGAANISVQNKAAVLRLDGRIDDVVDPGSIVKVGNGTLVLTTENTYRGGTTVKAGVLELQDSAKDGKTRTGSGDVVLEKGTQLAGNGKVAGKVDASKGGADVRPKAKSAGELTIGRGISFGPESSYTWELDFNTSSDTGGIPGADWSLIRLTFDDPSASLEIDPTAFLSIDLGSGVVIDDPFWTTPHLWKIIDVQSPSINNQFDFFEDVHLFGLDDPRVRTFAWTDPSRPDDLGDVFLEIRGIPEPASWVLGLTGISAVAGWHALRRRRRTRSTRPTELPARSIHHR
jgi:autotransporter-associated beta strand protein